MSTPQNLPSKKLIEGGELVTIERYQDTLEAELAKGRLESAGITAFLNGEEAGHLYGTGMGMLQLQVAAEDEEDALAIMNDPGTVDGDVTTIA